MNKWALSLLCGVICTSLYTHKALAVGYNVPFTDKVMEASYQKTKHAPVKVVAITEQGYTYTGTGWFIDKNTVIATAHSTLKGPVNYIQMDDGLDFAFISVREVYRDADTDVIFLEVHPKIKKDYKILNKVQVPVFAKGLTPDMGLYTVGYPYGTVAGVSYSYGAYLSAHNWIDWGQGIKASYASYAGFTVTAGLSGSPVYTAKGEVAGMVLGYTEDQDETAIFRPYEDIQRVYKAYLAKKGVKPSTSGTVVKITK